VLCAVFVALCAVSARGQGPPDKDWITFPESGFTAPAHRGAVNGIIADEAGLILSAGEDGFLGLWDGAGMRARERFQLSRRPLKKMAARPGRSEIAVYETDGLGFYRVSVWDYAEKTRLFALSFTDPVLFCGYTANGKYLVLGFGAGVSFFDPENGERRGEPLGGYPVTFAVSSPTERTLQTYSPSGVLAYWDIDNLTLSRSLSVPPNLGSPLVFGNYRFMAGQDGGQLFVVDAVSGRILYQTPSIPGILVCSDGAADSFFRLSVDNYRLRREDFTVGAAGAVQRAETFTNLDAPFSAAAPLGSTLVLLGCDDGRLAAWQGQDEAAFFSFRNQTRLSDAAASADGGIAFTDGNGAAGFIPAGFTEQPDAAQITLFDARGANRVTADNAFLFWHYGTADGGPPFVKTFGEAGSSADVSGDSLPPRQIRSADIYGGRVLFLDVSGGITVSWLDDGRPAFSYTSALPLDAVFVDDRRVLVARNAESGNAAPFLLVDYVSGETLPAAYPASMSFMLHRNRRGSIFCAVLKPADRHVITEVIKFDANTPQESPVIFTFTGEDTDFSFIEYGAQGDRYAATAGGEGAFIISDGNGQAGIDRTPAFPQKLLPLNGNFAALDADGSIAWYDGASGKLLAMLRLYDGEWLLSTSGGNTKRGSLTRTSAD
jgi:hypothetical protein